MSVSVTKLRAVARRLVHGGVIGLMALLAGGALAVRSAAAADRHSAMVIDANSGHVLFAQAADEPRYPASLTKLMTLYIVFELVEQGRLSRDARIRISETAAATAPSKLGLEAGSDIALSDAVKIIITKSANDIAVAVAEHIAGSEAKFAALMTRKAHALGMTATTFRNPHGLPDSGQVTTARDMLTLALRLNDDFPKYYPLFGLKSFTYGGNTYRNHNTMLITYPGMDGLKTGFTTTSGFNLVASVRRNGKHLVGAVFGGATAGARNAQMRTILDRALLRASTEKTRKPTLVARVQLRERPARKVAETAAPPLVEAPRPAARPRVASAAAPSSAPAPAAPVPAGARDAAPEPTPVARAATPITMAKVRPVLVAPKQRAGLAVQPERPAGDEPVAERTTEPPTPVAPPPQAIAFVAPPPPPAMAPVPAPASAPAGLPAPGRGAAPSSLQAQAERLRRGSEPLAGFDRPAVVAAATPTPSPTYRLRGPDRTETQASPRAPATGGQVALQVGAFSSEAEANRHIDAARGKVGALNQAQSAAQPAQQGGKQLYRARFVGLDAQTAATACIELRRAQIDCLVAPMR